MASKKKQTRMKIQRAVHGIAQKKKLARNQLRESKTDLYQILLINNTPLCWERARWNGRGRWFPIPRACRNCTTNCNDCFSRERWTPILSIQCSETRRLLELATRPDADGNYYVVGWEIQPDCRYHGGVVCVSDTG